MLSSTAVHLGEHGSIHDLAESEIYRGVIPFILIIIAVVILVTVFPQIVYFLPNLVAS